MKGKRFQLAREVREEVERSLALGELARLAETTERLVLEYCEMGLLGEEVREIGAEGRFGEGTLFLVRRIEQLRIEYGVSASGARQRCVVDGKQVNIPVPMCSAMWGRRRLAQPGVGCPGSSV